MGEYGTQGGYGRWGVARDEGWVVFWNLEFRI